jgi:tetratricopeptide (TPR) repeat protein
MLTPQRQSLAAAIGDYRMALSDVARAEELLQRAQDMAESINEKRAAFAGLSDEIAAVNADNVRRAIMGEDCLLTEPATGFAGRLVARDSADAQLQSVNEAIPLLREQLEGAKRRLNECDALRDAAAERVIATEADAMAMAHLQKLEALRAEHYVLNFLAMQHVKRAPSENVVASVPGQLYGSGPTRRVQMSPVVNEAISEQILGTSEFRGGLRVREAIGAQVASYFRALKDDPDAALDIGES